ncbi:MAG: biotin--[acetyl-CoA-carboxylase] ligase [Clostridiaceae bacterium]|nr:biotin--[acetyl-CoA-carboxylase] ligase [Clostridiaceae bacterium]
MKKKILKELYENAGEYISGEELSERFQVSRTAIWKHMNALKKEGYAIETAHKKGYKLVDVKDQLLPEGLRRDLTTKEIASKLIYFETIDSTNNYSKTIAREAQHGTVVISEEQTLGRGRLGRSWSSPKGEGVWMSIILKPEILPSEGAKMTQIAAAAVCKALRDTTGLEAYVKWPNDIVINGKKVCGILTEMTGELNEIYYLIVGIGINANIEKFPEEFQAIATSLSIEVGEKIDRRPLAVCVLNNFEELYNHYIEEQSLIKTLDIIKKYSAVIGKSIKIIGKNKERKAVALDINEEGLLKVRLEDGHEELVLSGEVSIRSEKGYI